MATSWQLQTPVPAIIFDCDGTLSMIEGIDELAKHNGVTAAVQALTAQAMGSTGIHPELYQQRLKLVYPRQEQVQALGRDYFKHLVPDVQHIIRILQRLQKTVYIVSAGLSPAVRIFGDMLQIPQENIFAVDIHFDAKGQFIDFEKTSPLVYRHGKRDIVNRLKLLHADIIHVGDGLNDFVTYDLVTRFIGYGGVFYRENIASQCQYYIRSLSMAPLLPLVLTQAEYEMLAAEEHALYQKGLMAIQEGTVSLRKS